MRQSVAIVHEDDAGEKRLVAYVVAENEARRRRPTTCAGTSPPPCPAYMVPSAIVPPRCAPADGEREDRHDRRCRSPGAARSDLRAAYVAPRTPTEEALAEIWRELLGVDRVGVNDDFFDLGGHSLLAVKMLARLHDAFGVELFLTTRVRAADARCTRRGRLGALLADAA